MHKSRQTGEKNIMSHKPVVLHEHDRIASRGETLERLEEVCPEVAVRITKNISVAFF